MEVTETRYARSGDRHIAYRTLGSGSVDLVFLPNWATNVETIWRLPALAETFERLTSWGRVLVFDQPGTGASDPVALDALPSLEMWMDSTRAVMDAAGVERGLLVAQDAAFLTAAPFAASFPERAIGLAGMHAWPRLKLADDFPIGIEEATLEATLRTWRTMWGTAGFQRFLNPNLLRNEQERAAWAEHERLAASPAMVRVMSDVLFAADVRHVLPLIRCPTVVMHRERSRSVPVAIARYIADSIPGARLSLYPGIDHYLFVGTLDRLDAELRELAGLSRATPASSDRFLATVLFTDIVSSTDMAARVGDAAWRELLDEHDRAARAAVERFGGRTVKSTGDGVLATFDGPARAVRCTQELSRQLSSSGVEIRAGLHAGEIEARGEDVAGMAVVIASRISALARPREILVSSTVKDLVVGSGLRFEERGAHALKGVEDRWTLYAVQ